MKPVKLGYMWPIPTTLALLLALSAIGVVLYEQSRSAASPHLPSRRWVVAAHIRQQQVVESLPVPDGWRCHEETFGLETSGGGLALRVTYFTDETTGLRFVAVPAGHFVMGSADPDESPFRDAMPAHVNEARSPFYMGSTEVTESTYLGVMGTRPPVSRDYGAYPVAVAWADAVEFCERATGLSGVPIRLPSEAEWEYACRAGTQTRFNLGDRISDLGRAGWFRENSRRRARPVGLKQPNAWGLYDMHGNESEWCQSPYAPYPLHYLGAEPSESRNDFRILRGGGYDDPWVCCTSAARQTHDSSYRYIVFGFRVVADPLLAQPPIAAQAEQSTEPCQGSSKERP